MSTPDQDDDRTVIVSAPGTGAAATRSEGSSLGHNALEVGAMLGEFEVTGLVGEGGFGIVYLAYDHSLERKVALKEYMPSELAQREGGTTVIVRSKRHAETFAAGLRSFINEARLLAQFDHPSLVKVYRFWEANGTAYMVMPFYEGITLKETLRNLGEAPDEAWLKSLLAQLLDALEIIHNRQCYHRDIAPDNILILPDQTTPLLLDFGAARRVIGDMTQALTVILKPGYAPIEQYAEVPNMKQGPWTDLYALASVVYFAITGKAPVPAVARVMSDPLVPLSQCAAGRYSDTFLRAIDKTLSVRPEDRPQNIAALRDALGFQERSQATRFMPTDAEPRAVYEPVGPTPAAAIPGRSQRAETPAKNAKLAIIAGAVAAVLLIGAFVGFLVLDEPLPSAGTGAPKATAPVSASAAGVLDAVKAKLGTFECARLESAVDGGKATVRGHVSAEGELQRLSADLAAVSGVSAVDRSGVRVIPPPHCHVASALAPYAGHPTNGPLIALKNGGTAAYEGEKLITTVTAGDSPGFVYADLYDTEGNVAHMLPNSREKNARLEAGQKLVLGDDALFGVQWDVVPPFGKHLLVVMTSKSPLFAAGRPDVEKAGAYLMALREDLDRKPPGDPFVASYTLIDFMPKK